MAIGTMCKVVYATCSCGRSVHVLPAAYRRFDEVGVAGREWFSLAARVERQRSPSSVEFDEKMAQRRDARAISTADSTGRILLHNKYENTINSISVVTSK